MSSDAKGMLEVNRDLILRAARESALPEQEGAYLVVVSAATWGRGSTGADLADLKRWQKYSGFNSSVVAVPPPEVTGCFLDPMPQPSESGSFLAAGVAFGKTHWEWWNYDGSQDLPELF